MCETCIMGIIYNKPTRCNSGSIIFINNYKYAVHNLMFFWPCIIVLTFSNYQLNAQFFYFSTIYIYIYITLHSSTCFEQHAAHPQEDQLYHHSLWYRHSSQTAVQYTGVERTAVRFPPAYCTAVYRGWRYQRLWWYNRSSWGWAACCSKHVEERTVIYIYIYIVEK